MTTKTILQDAYALLEKPYAWGKGTYEKSTPRGTRFCLQGAVRHVSGYSVAGGEAVNFLDKRGCTIDFNDKRTTTKAMVLAALKRAIRKAA